MTDLRFRSLDSTRMYVLRSASGAEDYYYRNPAGFLDAAVYHYDTLGDGDTQHTPTVHVPTGYLRDYCLSFARALMDEPDFDHASSMASTGWPACPHTDADMRFALSLTHNEDKRTFYSLRENKTSRADSKRYDKRWEEVPSYCDGTGRSAFRILTQSHWGLLDRIVCARAIERVAGLLGIYCPRWDALVWPDEVAFDNDRHALMFDVMAAVHATTSITAKWNALRVLRIATERTTPATGTGVAESSAA